MPTSSSILAQSGVRGRGIAPESNCASVTGIKRLPAGGTVNAPRLTGMAPAADNFASPGGIKRDADYSYSEPAYLRLNEWSFSGQWLDQKQARLAQLQGRARFEFHQINIADPTAMTSLVEHHPDIDAIIHLAAQAGVRYSLTQPLATARTGVPRGAAKSTPRCGRLRWRMG